MSGPPGGTQTTHNVELGAAIVVKEFRSWGRGEHRREWGALTLLAKHAPGLAPVPLREQLDRQPPRMVMSRLPGCPLGRGPVPAGDLTKLLVARQRLQRSAPAAVLDSLPLRLWHPAEALTTLRGHSDATLRGHSETAADGGLSALVGDALGAGWAWIRGAELDRFAAARPDYVLGHADGNLANYLVEGRSCRAVDFEDSGRSDATYELADLLEHLSSWLTGAVEADAVLRCGSLDGIDPTRLLTARRLFGCFWLLRLLPGGGGHARNAPGTLERQAARLLDLLG
ncbi:MAG: phosphotransferase [Nocardioidaceae bacterium]